jgi:hypothetical protein
VEPEPWDDDPDGACARCIRAGPIAAPDRVPSAGIRGGRGSYYDLQNAIASQPGHTDAYLVTCPAATSDCTSAANWAAGGQTLLSTTGSFDMTTAPGSDAGYFVGDYEGLTSSGNIVMAQPIATKGPTGPFSNTAG